MNTAQTIIGIDYGLKRIGVAVGNTLTQHAEPLEIIPNTDFPSVLARLQRLIQEWQANALVLGLPRHPDGTAHTMTQACMDFHAQIHGKRCRCPFIGWMSVTPPRFCPTKPDKMHAAKPVP